MQVIVQSHDSKSDLIRVGFPGVLSTDTVVSVGTAVFPTPVVASELPSTNPQFYAGTDTDGNWVLCTVKSLLYDLSAVFGTAGTVIALPLVAPDMISSFPTR